MVRKLHLLIFIALAALVLPVLIATAQDGSSIEFVGFIEATDGTSITVNGQVIDVTTAELDAQLVVGAPVRVEGSLNANGQIVAREIQSVDNDLELDDVEVTGVVTSFDGTTLVVGGLTLDVTGAEVNPGIDMGSLVTIHLVLSDTGTLTVREVNIAGDNDDDGNDDANDDNDDANDDNGDDNNDANDDNGDDNDDANDDDNSDDSSGVGNDDDANDDNNGDAGNDDLDANELRLVGTLDAVGDGFVVISGQTIVTTGAQLDAPLLVGSRVRIDFSVVNGQFVASEVDFDNSGPGSNGNNGDDTLVLPGDCSVPTGWTTYTIQPGDSLSGIASRSGSSINDLTAANCISNDTVIFAGNVLAVPRAPSGNSGSGSGNSGSGNGDDNNDDGNGDDNNDNANDDNGDDNGDDNSGGNSGPGGGDDRGGDNGDDDNGDDDNGDNDSGGDNGDDDNGDDDSGGNSGSGGGDDDDD